MSIKHLFSLIIFFLTIQSIKPFTIMIDPSGDAKHTGRIIEDTFERGITLQCVEELKKEINKVLPHVRIVLTRVPGESIQPLQNASFANRLQVDLYLSIYFYSETDAPSHVALYHYLVSSTDLWHQHNPLSFYHIDQAHLINVAKTQDIAQRWHEILQSKQQNPFFVSQGLFALPFQPLLGIKAPALSLEAGLNKKNDWKQLIQPLATCIKEIAS